MADDSSAFRDAYDTTTGRKLPYKVPESHFAVFPNIRKTPLQKQKEREPKAQVTRVTEPKKEN